MGSINRCPSIFHLSFPLILPCCLHYLLFFLPCSCPHRGMLSRRIATLPPYHAISHAKYNPGDVKCVCYVFFFATATTEYTLQASFHKCFPTLLETKIASSIFNSPHTVSTANRIMCTLVSTCSKIPVHGCREKETVMRDKASFLSLRGEK